METVLVTGGAGFIGSHLTERLAKKNFSVIVFDNLSSYTYPKEYKEENLAILKNYPNVTFVKGNITSKTELRGLFQTHAIDRVFHLAALPGVRRSLEHPADYFLVNTLGSSQLIEEACKNNVKQLILASSSSIYGNGPVPFIENSPTPLAYVPLSPYGMSKKSAERAAYEIHETYKVPIIILRLFSVYGPRGRPDMTPYLFLRAILSEQSFVVYGGGTLARDWTYVDDIVNGLTKTLSLHDPFTVINLGNNHPIKVIDLVKTLEIITGKKANYQLVPAVPPGDVRKTHADITLAKELLGWEPQVKLEEGLPLFYEWYLKERFQKESP